MEEKIFGHISTTSHQPQICPHLPLFLDPLRAGGLEKHSLSLLVALTVHLIPAMREQTALGPVCYNFFPHAFISLAWKKALVKRMVSLGCFIAVSNKDGQLWIGKHGTLIKS